MSSQIFEDTSTFASCGIGENKSILVTVLVGASLNNFFLLNMSKTCQADFSAIKAIDGDFIINSFGNNLTTITVGGLQPSYISTPLSILLTDAELKYQLYNIGSPYRMPAYIVMSHLGIYKGYMTGFTQQPSGMPGIGGYGYTITFIAAYQGLVGII